MQTSKQLEINRILKTVAEYKASDLHLTVGNPPILRIDGKLTPLQEESLLTPDFIQGVVESFLDDKQKEILEREREIVVAYTLENKARFKVNIFYQKGHPSVSLRYVPPTIKTIQELNLPPIVKEFTKLEKGLVLICGPFGSGRTTTMTSLVDQINKSRAEHIITIEKPIEYLFVNNKSVIEQREVGLDVLSFERALESVSEEDVDIIMLSKIEGVEIIEEVLNVASSGRLVLANMDTDSAFKTVEEIIASFPPERQSQGRVHLADSLEGIISQRLVPRTGGGLVLACEVLIPNQAIRSIIRDGALYQLNNILLTSRGEGMVSLDRSLAELVKKGEILLEDALNYAIDRNNLKTMTKR